MNNKYKGTCIECRCEVAPGEGVAKKSKKGRWFVLCADHAENSAPRNKVNHYYSPVTGNSWMQNANGRCEDDPCCGCCNS